MSEIKIWAVKFFINFLSLFTGFNCIVRLICMRILKGDRIWNRRVRTRPECLDQFGKHEFMNLRNGIRIHYVEDGNKSKPLMLFVHGFPEFWYSWRHQLKHFASNYWVVAVDMPGYGESGKPSGAHNYTQELLEQNVVEMIQSLGRSKCILVGHDWGGIVATGVAQNHPEVVEKLILLNVPHKGAFAMHILKSFQQLLKSWYIFFFQLRWLPEIFVAADDFYFFDFIFKGTLNHEELDVFKFNFSQRDSLNPAINYYRNIFTENVIRHPLISPKISKIPTLLIWGTDDLALEKNIAENTRHFIENLQIKYIEDGSHWIQQHRPSDVNELMDEFI